MTPEPEEIPEDIDVLALIAALNVLGWKDYKIEAKCVFAKGYIAAVKVRRVKNPRYRAAAKLYNLLQRETLKSSPSSQAIA